MKLTCTLIAALLFTAPDFAQTATELLQKGIYAEETSGNLDEAISIYRQIVNSASGQRDIAAQAQYRLAETLIRKGDLTGAAAEFQKLARDYPDQQALLRGSKVALALGRGSAPSSAPGSLTAQAGVLQSGHYHHNLTGVEFDLPFGWSIGTTKPTDGNPSEMTVLVDPEGKAIFASAAMSKVESPPASISGALSRAVPQRVQIRANAAPPHGVPNYTIREGSVEQTYIGGQQAVRAIGEYQQGGQKIVELLTWIITEHTRAYFFAKVASDDLPAVQVPFEQMLQSAKIP
jgi:tetratricopeptide (TPR) repeat protein